MQRRLIEANAQSDAQYLDEVASLMREIKSAWDAIPPEVRTRQGAEAAAARGE